jgi:ABC-type branched-subunit amino acid transport system substrate-binding protein
MIRMKTALGIAAWTTVALLFGACTPKSTGGAAAPAQSPKKSVFVVLPLTGPAATWGEHFKRGSDMFALTVTNSRIDVRIIDSQSTPAAALSALRQAALSGKPYAVVSTLSGTTVPVKEWTDSEGIFLVACVITDKVIDDKGLTQRIYPSAEDNAGPLAAFAKRRYRSVAILHSNDELGTAVRRVFEREFVGGDRTITLADAYALKETEVRTLVAKYVEAKSEAILVTGIGPAFWAIIRELRSQKFSGTILSDASFADQTQIEALGEMANGIVFMGSETELTQPRTPAAMEFAQRYKSSFDKPVNYTGVTVYESLRILNEMAGKHASLSNSDFVALRDWSGVPGNIRMLPRGDCAYPWFLVERVGGENKVVQAE